jgi:uncharacterized repeat protein (TIGR03987 family)
MFVALAFYTVGVWSQYRAKRLERRHVILFWAGLLADAAGTAMMFRLAGELSLSPHSISGLLVLALALIHSVAATDIFVRRRQRWLGRFYRVSLVFWVIWMIPFLTGLLIAAHR